MKEVIILSSIILNVMSIVGVIPRWMVRVYIMNFLVCMFGWEVWMTYGLVGGDSVRDRKGDTGYNQLNNLLLMSTCDGWIGVLQVWCVRELFGKSSFTKGWRWKEFMVMWLVGVIQNVFVTVVLRKRMKGKLSLAPLMPVRANAVVQNQEPWILQPFVVYPILLKMNKSFFTTS